MMFRLIASVSKIKPKDFDSYALELRFKGMGTHVWEDQKAKRVLAFSKISF